MRYLSDNYTIKNALTIALSSCFDMINTRSKSDSRASECFLSCSTLKINELTPKKPQKLIRATTYLSEIIQKGPVHYRADSSSKKSLSSNLDGISGPTVLDSKCFIIGIDPGITGAIAVILIGEKPSFVGVFDMPTYELKVGKKLRKRIDLTALSFLLESYASKARFALIEDVGQIGTNADPFSSFVFGFATGAVHGALTMAGVKVDKVTPQAWKNSMGLDSDKTLSLKLAIKLFPESSKYLSRKMDHGRAEAILIAWFGWKHMRKV